jgi:hypothetical protein
VKAGGEGVWVNLDLVTKIVPFESKATLHFVDGSTLSVDCPANQVADHANDRSRPLLISFHRYSSAVSPPRISASCFCSNLKGFPWRDASPTMDS